MPVTRSSTRVSRAGAGTRPSSPVRHSSVPDVARRGWSSPGVVSALTGLVTGANSNSVEIASKRRVMSARLRRVEHVLRRQHRSHGRHGGLAHLADLQVHAPVELLALPCRLLAKNAVGTDRG